MRRVSQAAVFLEQPEAIRMLSVFLSRRLGARHVRECSVRCCFIRNISMSDNGRAQDRPSGS